MEKYKIYPYWLLVKTGRQLNDRGLQLHQINKIDRVLPVLPVLL